MNQKIKDAIMLKAPGLPEIKLDEICEKLDSTENGILYLTEDLMTHEGRYMITDRDIYAVALELFESCLNNADLSIRCVIEKHGDKYYTVPFIDIYAAATEIRMGVEEI